MNNKTLVIISNADLCIRNGIAYIRNGFETQIDDFSSKYKESYFYSPVVSDHFTGYVFQNKIECRPLIHGLHDSKISLVLKIPEYCRALCKIFRRHKDATYLIYIPDSYIGILALFISKYYGHRLICRITNDMVDEYVSRKKSIVRVLISRTFGTLLNKLIYLFLIGHPTFFTGKLFLGKRPEFYPITSCSLRKADLPIARRPRIGVTSIYYIGRIEENKGWRHLLNAAILLPDSMTINIVGYGLKSQMDEFIIASKSCASGAKIVFHGYVPFGPALFEHLNYADVLVVPSINEYQGKTHLEGMAFGCAVIASNVDGISQYIKNEVNGLLVNPGVPKLIANAIIRLSSDQYLLDKLSSNAFNGATSFTVEEMNNYIFKKINN